MYDPIVSLGRDACSNLTLLTVGPLGSYSSRFHDVSGLVGTFSRGSFPGSGFEVTFVETTEGGGRRPEFGNVFHFPNKQFWHVSTLTLDSSSY